MAFNDQTIEIQASRHSYQVQFMGSPFAALLRDDGISRHAIVDARVMNLYRADLQGLNSFQSVLEIDATEDAKSLHHFSSYVSRLMDAGFKRDHRLVVIGGGIMQDITAFLATTLMRGVDWEFYPTTLLAQADSCIGSKSSINVGNLKNILGSFHPPIAVYQNVDVLATLAEHDVRSGIGEILKAVIIDGPESFDRLAADYEHFLGNYELLSSYIRQSLLIKKRFIEEDEFDKGIRNVFNYGHSFGHAIEVATSYAIPHGLAVSIGMDLANFMAWKIGRLDEMRFRAMHRILSFNYTGFENINMSLDDMLKAMGKDKKNTGSDFTVILPNASAIPAKIRLSNDGLFRSICEEFFAYSCAVKLSD